MADLGVAEIHWPVGSLQNRFHIIETVKTVDGYRDRITNQSFGTLQEALDWIKEHQQ